MTEKQTPVKAVLSDAGGILFDDTYGVNIIYPAAAIMLGITKNQLETEYRPWKEKAQTKPNYGTLDAWKDYLITKNKPESALYELATMYSKSWANIRPYPGVSSTVAELEKRGIEFIVLTDAAMPARFIEKKMRHDYNIDKGLTGVISSKDLGVTKPNKKFFDTALRRYGLRQDEVVFLAHDYDELKGAYDLGYRVLALNFDSDEDLSFIPRSQKLRRFSELLKKLKPWKDKKRLQ
jgi:FMN phosphatase YigB (HAD superfamily)